MRKFSIKILKDLDVRYNHYLSYEFIKEKECCYYFEGWYPLYYYSRRFDKPAIKYKYGSCCWKLDNKCHREGKPAFIRPDGSVSYWENGEWIK